MIRDYTNTSTNIYMRIMHVSRSRAIQCNIYLVYLSYTVYTRSLCNNKYKYHVYIAMVSDK